MQVSGSSGTVFDRCIGGNGLWVVPLCGEESGVVFISFIFPSACLLIG